MLEIFYLSRIKKEKSLWIRDDTMKKNNSLPTNTTPWREERERKEREKRKKSGNLGDAFLSCFARVLVPLPLLS